DPEELLGSPQQCVMVESGSGTRTRCRVLAEQDHRDLVIGRVVVFVPGQEDGRLAGLVVRAGKDPRDETLKPSIARCYRAIVHVITEVRRDEAERWKRIGVEGVERHILRLT